MIFEIHSFLRRMRHRAQHPKKQTARVPLWMVALANMRAPPPGYATFFCFGLAPHFFAFPTRADDFSLFDHDVMDCDSAARAACAKERILL
jgi:hypothetical protein